HASLRDNGFKTTRMMTFVWRMVFRIVLAIVAGWLLATPCQAAEEFLTADQAFALQARTAHKGQVQIELRLAHKAYLYRDRFRVESKTPAVALTPMSLPPGQRKFDETFGKEVEVYHGLVPLQFGVAPTTPAGTSVLVEVGYQGCADAGLCYPPQSKQFSLTVGQAGQVTEVTSADPNEPLQSKAPSATSGPGGRIETALASGNLPTVIGVFLVAGMLLSLTPCVLPMMPILSAVIIGQG